MAALCMGHLDEMGKKRRDCCSGLRYIFWYCADYFQDRGVREARTLSNTLWKDGAYKSWGFYLHTKSGFGVLKAQLHKQNGVHQFVKEIVGHLFLLTTHAERFF